MGDQAWALGVAGVAAVGIALGIAIGRTRAAPAPAPTARAPGGCRACQCDPSTPEVLPDAPFGQRFALGNRAALYLG